MLPMATLATRRPTMIRTLFAVIGTLIALSSTPAAADYDRLIGVFIGGLELDEQTGDRIDENGQPIAIEFPTLPTGGIEGEYRYGGERIAWGLNPGGSIAWKSSGTRVSGGFTSETGGVIRIDIDNSLFIGELHLGGYLRGRLTESITAYIAAGPMVTYGRIEVEDDDLPGIEPAGTIELESSNSSDFGFGYYARAGIDFSIGGEQSVGVGVRYMRTKLDFDNDVGEIDLEGPSFILSFTMPM